MRMIILVLGLMSTMMFVSTPALAQARGYLGVQGGLSVPDADDTSSRLGYGVVGGARLDGEFGIGAYYLNSSKEESVAGTDVDFNYQLYGFEGTFHFEGVADGGYVGLRVGISKVDVGGIEFSPTSYGALFGYDYFVKDNWSVGLEGSYMRVEGDDKDGVELDGFSTLQLLASTKVWF